MRNLNNFTKTELAELIGDIIDEVKNNEGMGIARILTDNKLMTEQEYEDVTT